MCRISRIWALDLYNHTLSPHITSLAIDITQNYTTLNFYSWTPTLNVGGDIQPFLDAGFSGIYFMEHYINPNYHKKTDLIEYCDLNYLAEATKVSLGCILLADFSVGQKEPEVNPEKVSVFPNPVSDKLNFSLPETEEDWQLGIYDTRGMKVYGATLAGGMNSLDISEVAGGIYVLRFNSKDKSLLQKLVVKK